MSRAAMRQASSPEEDSRFAKEQKRKRACFDLMNPKMMHSATAKASSHVEDSQLTDEGKLKRMISNRESARRSRARKQQRLQDLTSEAAELQNANRYIEEQINLRIPNYIRLEEENTTLRSQLAELTEMLQSLNSVLYILQVASGVPMDILEMPDPLLKPPPPPPLFMSEPITAIADMVQL